MQGGRILACTDVGDGQTMASGSSNGSLHVWRVEYTTRPGGNPDRYTGIAGGDLQALSIVGLHAPDNMY